MTVKMTAADWQAKGDAYEEAAEHLLMHWTDDERERLQGLMVSGELMKRAEVCWRNAEHLPETRMGHIQG